MAEENEREDSRRLANKILDRPFGDPDDDLAVLSRQLLRADELIVAQREQNIRLVETLTKVRDGLLEDGYKDGNYLFLLCEEALDSQVQAAPEEVTAEVTMVTGAGLQALIDNCSHGPTRFCLRELQMLRSGAAPEKEE